MPPRIGVHESVDRLFPIPVVEAALAAEGLEVASVGSAGPFDGFDGIVTFAHDAAFIDAGVPWVHSVQAAGNRLALAELADGGVIATSSAGIHGDTAGETVAGYMLMFARGLHLHVRSQVAKEWRPPPWDVPFSLTGEPVCVVGLGTLGRGIARRADGLGMPVTGVRRTPLPVDHVDTVYSPDELTEAITTARFVALAVPLTDATRGLIGAAELEVMREDAYLVNIARGAVVDEPALIDALQRETIAGAALDVFQTEPLPADSPLWELENVIVSPHEATDHRDKPRDIARLVRENARRLRAGEPLANRLT